MKTRILLLLMPLLLVACTSTIELEPEPYEPKLVLDGFIETGSVASVYLTWSSPFLSQYDSVSIRKTFVNVAKISLMCEGDTEVLTLYRESRFFPPFVYKSRRIKGVAGKTYSLKIEALGRVLTASTTIPEPPVILSLKMEEISDTAGYLSAWVKPSVASKTRLFVQTRSFLADDYLHPAKIPVYLIPASDADSLRILIYRTNQTNLYLESRTESFYRRYPVHQYALTDTVQVKVGTLDEASYQVLKSLFADQAVRSNPFAFNSAGIQTNVTGGLGRWTGIGSAGSLYYVRR